MSENILLAGGCFWCLEAIFRQVEGVREVTPGYCGGGIPTPTYAEVCAGQTGHVEVVRVCFDPAKISLHDLLVIFFTLHDPTTLNRQGADLGTQYRSVVFYNSTAQKKVAQEVIKELTGRRIWPAPIITSLEPAKEFYPAEEYHQRYYQLNREAPYCQLVIAPKIQQLRQQFSDKLRLSLWT